jgi:hypothetical protein
MEARGVHDADVPSSAGMKTVGISSCGTWVRTNKAPDAFRAGRMGASKFSSE